jgi:hypothetical protein
MKSSFVFSVAAMNLLSWRPISVCSSSCSLQTAIPYSCPVSRFELAA